MSRSMFFSAVPPHASNESGTPCGFRLCNRTRNVLRVRTNGSSGKSELVNPGADKDFVGLTTYIWEVCDRENTVNFQFFSGEVSAVIVDENGPHLVRSQTSGWSCTQGYGVINAANALGLRDDEIMWSDDGQSNAASLNLIRAPVAWNAGYYGEGVTVAVLDAGIAPHEQIEDRICGYHNAFAQGEPAHHEIHYYPDHALAVASIIAGRHDIGSDGLRTLGVAPKAKILNVKVTSAATAVNDVIPDAVKWAVVNGARVLCLPVQNEQNGISESLVDALEFAKVNGTVVVVIGGNFCRWGGSGPSLAIRKSLGIAVGNYNMITHQTFSESNVPGDQPCPWVVAPSAGWYPSASGGFSYYANGGTSFAGPYVAGLAALLVEAYPTAAPEEVMERLTGGAVLTE
jgi:subtilisin family serine protease